MTDSRRPQRGGHPGDKAATSSPPLREHVKQTHRDPVLRRLMVLVTVAVILGMIGTAAAVVGATQTRDASRADVARAAELTRILAEQQQQAERRSFAFRTDTRLLLEAVCDQIEAIADTVPSLVQRRDTIPDCPVLPPVPQPVGEPDPPTPQPLD